MVGNCAVPTMKGSIEAGDLEQVRTAFEQNANRRQVVRLMQGCKWNIAGPSGDYLLVEDHGRVVFRSAVDHPMANRNQVGGLRLTKPFREHADRRRYVRNAVRQVLLVNLRIIVRSGN